MKQIAAALVKAQKSFGPALKTSTNPHFKSRYADLAACVEAVIEGLNSAGIMLMQSCHESDSGVIVETVFVHESGETMSAGKLHVPAAKQDPQGYGSALTYARRYSLMAACGIAPEDDDGNAATKAKGVELVESRKKISTSYAETLSDERKQALTAKAQEIDSLWLGEPDIAVREYVEFRDNLDTDEQAAFKHFLDEENPKLRNGLLKHYKAMNEKAA